MRRLERALQSPVEISSQCKSSIRVLLLIELLSTCISTQQGDEITDPYLTSVVLPQKGKHQDPSAVVNDCLSIFIQFAVAHTLQLLHVRILVASSLHPAYAVRQSSTPDLTVIIGPCSHI